MTVRIALLTEIPAPFRIPLFNALDAYDDVELHAFFLGLEDPKRPYPVYSDEFRFRWRVLPGRNVVERPRWVVANTGVRRALRDADVVVLGGWNQPAFWTAAAWARARRLPLVLWVESTARDARTNLPPFELAKRALARASAAVIVPGRASAEYARALGVPPRRVHVAPNAVDAALFGNRVDELRRDRDALRRELGVEGCVALCVARLDPEKGVDVLLDAARRVDGLTVVHAGAGADETALRARAPEGARFLGRIPREEVARWYAAADVFVLPSRSDQWGMVLNEAATAGLPLVASEAAGAAHDLVEDGVNGFRVPAGDVAALAGALARLCDDEALRERAGARSREIAARFTPEAWAQAVREVARGVLS